MINIPSLPFPHTPILSTSDFLSHKGQEKVTNVAYGIRTGTISGIVFRSPPLPITVGRVFPYKRIIPHFLAFLPQKFNLSKNKHLAIQYPFESALNNQTKNSDLT